MTTLTRDQAIRLAQVHGAFQNMNVVGALQTAYAAGFADASAQFAEFDSMSESDLDLHLDQVLRAAGSALSHYSMEKSKAEMRAAMRRFATAAAGVKA